MRGALKEWAIRISMVVVSLLVGLVLTEIVVRIFFPLYGGRDNVTLSGESITSFVDAGSVYHQVSNEYNALTTITSKGYRAPEATGDPEVVFIGDSFTFGFGLADDETFAALYCKQTHRSCANLGVPGTGTSRQVGRLKEFLNTWHWRPKQVKLFFFGMSRSFSNGNDFVDNYNYAGWLQRRQAEPDVLEVSNEGRAPAQTQQPRRRGLGEYIISWQTAILENVHLMRRIKYHWGPLLRTMVLSEPGEERKAEALRQTKRSLEELDELSKQTGFEYEIYLIVPSQDIIMGTYGETLQTLSRLTAKPVVPTAQLFVESPGEFYFSYDGHINQKGARRIAELLVARDGGRTN